MLKGQLEESKRIEETLEDLKQCLEIKIMALKEVEKREKILEDHLNERTNELSQLEEKFVQEERILEKKIISLKIQLEEAKRTKEVVKIQMMKKEEEVENLEEEVVTLRVKIVKLSQNVEETETSTLIVENEEKHSRLSKEKNEEKGKIYAEVLKRMNHSQQESKNNEYNRDTSSTRPTTFMDQRSFNHNEGIHRREYHDHPRQEFKRTTPQRRSFTPKYVNLFCVHCFYYTNFGHKVADCRVYGRNIQARCVYVAPHNIKCYKFHNYGHIACD
jgi:hypothetical protein